MESDKIEEVKKDEEVKVRLNRAQRRKLMKRFGTFGRLARTGKVKV